MKSTETRRIRIVIADDHTILREGVGLLIRREPEFSLVGEASTGPDAIALARELQPDVAVLDINMPLINGIQATTILQTEAPSVRVLLLTMHDQVPLFLNAIQAGAAGYLLKKSTASDLVAAIRAVAAGEGYLPPALARHAIGQQRSSNSRPTKRSGIASLSNREREVMLGLVRGMSNREIAEQLVISTGTVQTHRMHILQKLDVSSIAELVRVAIEVGFIELR